MFSFLLPRKRKILYGKHLVLIFMSLIQHISCKLCQRLRHILHIRA